LSSALVRWQNDTFTWPGLREAAPSGAVVCSGDEVTVVGDELDGGEVEVDATEDVVGGVVVDATADVVGDDVVGGVVVAVVIVCAAAGTTSQKTGNAATARPRMIALRTGAC
jgi:hypothetical protein